MAGLAVFRLDFIAAIKTDTGEHKTVLIEIQKAKNPIDLLRFRNYLAEQYKKEDTVNNENIVLPITTIYFLGFKLPEIETFLCQSIAELQRLNWQNNYTKKE